MKNPLVSIIIPAYNAEHFLTEVVSSVLNQTYKNIEVILIDDGSKDGTWQLMQQFADPRVKIFHQMNMGACVARNRGFSESHGEYVKFFDADDIMCEDAVELQVKEALKRTGNVITYGYCTVKNDIKDEPKVFSCEKFQGQLLSNSYGLDTSLPMYPRDIFKAINGFDIRLDYSQDTDLTLQCMYLGYKFEFIDVHICNQRLGINKNCISFTRKNFFPILIILNKYRKQLKEDSKWRECLCNYGVCCMIYSLEINEELYGECKEVFQKLPFKELWSRFVYKGSRPCGRLFVLLTYILPNSLSYKITENIFRVLHYFVCKYKNCKE